MSMKVKVESYLYEVQQELSRQVSQPAQDLEKAEAKRRKTTINELQRLQSVLIKLKDLYNE